MIISPLDLVTLKTSKETKGVNKRWLTKLSVLLSGQGGQAQMLEDCSLWITAIPDSALPSARRSCVKPIARSTIRS